MRVHFIAIGGAVMHNLAIALHLKGDIVSGSDDAIFEPSRSRLKHYALMPDNEGWNADCISSALDAVILGMHAREDNPELIRARELNIPVYSFPEFLYRAYKEKTRVVVAGSHGKTSITAMILHVLQKVGMDPDYMVGAQLEGFDVMVKISEGKGIAVLEGDEYLTSPLDRRPKFLHYYPHIALLSGIAWDHINVFPTEKEYFNQFEALIRSIEVGGSLVYCASDNEVKRLLTDRKESVEFIPYDLPSYRIDKRKTVLIINGIEYPIRVFGKHNMQNISGAHQVCKILGVSDESFFEAIQSFSGAARRLEKIATKKESVVFRDFAHAPSKLRASVEAVREQYPDKKIFACIELHTFSSLNREFLPHYKSSLDAADEAVVFYSLETLKAKRLAVFSSDEVKTAFGREDILVLNDPGQLEAWLKGLLNDDSVLLLMSSGNFQGIPLKEILQQYDYDIA